VIIILTFFSFRIININLLSVLISNEILRVLLGLSYFLQQNKFYFYVIKNAI